MLLNTGRRMFAGSRPIDIVMLVVELLVLAIIAIEYGGHVWEKRRIKVRLAAIRSSYSQGQRLQLNAPRGLGVSQASQEWTASVRQWIDDTRSLLQLYSDQAAASFVHDPIDSPQVHHTIPDPVTYALLATRLSNLRGIMEKPEVYF
jgi:hypothetical protein